MAVTGAWRMQKHRGYACFHICGTKTRLTNVTGSLENGQKSGKWQGKFREFCSKN